MAVYFAMNSDLPLKCYTLHGLGVSGWIHYTFWYLWHIIVSTFSANAQALNFVGKTTCKIYYISTKWYSVASEKRCFHYNNITSQYDQCPSSNGLLKDRFNI